MLGVTGTDLWESMHAHPWDSGRGCTREVMGLEDEVNIGAKLDPLSVGIVRRWLSSDGGMYCAITKYKHNRTYVTKLHRCTLSPLPLWLTHVRNV